MASWTGRALLRRGKLLVLIAITTTTVIFAPVSYGESSSWSVVERSALAIMVLSAYASYRVLRSYVRTEKHRTTLLTQAARLEGVSLATATLQHHIGNRLVAAVAYSELLADDPRLPVDLQAEASKIYRSTMAAAEVVRGLEDKLTNAELDTTLAGPKLLEIRAPTDGANRL